MDQVNAKKAIVKMFLAFPLPGTNSEINEGRLRAYWEVLSRIEPEFVIEACEYASLGKCGDGRFLPSAGELYQLAEELRARAIRSQKLSAPRIAAPAQVYVSGQRQRIIEGFNKLLSDLMTGVPIDPDKATREVFGKDTGGRFDHVRSAPQRVTSHEVENHPLTAADWPAIRVEVRRIVESRGIPEFAAQVEWRKFREWFTGLGPTTLRWWVEWPKWLDEKMVNIKDEAAE